MKFWHSLVLLASLILSSAGCGVFGFGDSDEFFSEAVPVWARGQEAEMNLTMVFEAEFADPGEDAVLKVAASSIYRARLNGRFLASGPARGPHGYFRVDRIDLSGLLEDGINKLSIDVAGYNCNSYYLLDQPSFLQAEVSSPDRVMAATGPGSDSFNGFLLKNRLQKVQRFSFQRPFTEAYRYSSPEPDLESVELSAYPVKNLLERGVRYPEYQVYHPRELFASGIFEPIKTIHPIERDRALTGIGPELKGFPEKELEYIPTLELQNFSSVASDAESSSWSPDSEIDLVQYEWEMVDFGRNLTGFVGAEIECGTLADVRLMFGEVLTEEGDIDALKQGQVRVLTWKLGPGVYRVEAIEPYTMRYLKAACFEGEAVIRSIYLREFAHPGVDEMAGFSASDDRLNKIFQAGVETYRQNSLDIFMDCPSRERAGWLCDSFFTARVEYELTGESKIEDAFFENYLLPESFANIPAGMVPMCYPADHYNGNFIPNWALWFIIQLDEYAQRTGREEQVRMLEDRVIGILNYLKQFENDDGLLESLDGWVFIEWSEANEWVQDLNFPTNMQYAAALETAARLYNRPGLEVQAAKIRETIRDMSFNGEFFVDNAVRSEDGILELTGNQSEVCQYFAFYFGIASPESHPELWRKLADEFGPEREAKGLYPEVSPANSFIGNMLRMELLSEDGRSRQIMDESVEYLLYMAKRTGTLWENVHPNASTNHGFASHACRTLFRDVLGLYRVDRKKRSITVRFADVPLEACEGYMPTPEGEVRLAWRKTDGAIEYRLNVPDDYQVELVNDSGFPLEDLGD